MKRWPLIICLVIITACLLIIIHNNPTDNLESELESARGTSSSNHSEDDMSVRSPSPYSDYDNPSIYKSGSAPARPPVNRTPAMTKEEAERLRGTGFRGCKPNSSAENSELKAAQNKCANCGYYTDNGGNSYCDYCTWMMKWGNGLP